MGKWKAAWAEDRREVFMLVGLLVAGVLAVIGTAFDVGQWFWVAQLFVYGTLVTRQASEVFLNRPRRFEATGDRSGGGFWG